MLISCYCNTLDDANVLNIVTEFKRRNVVLFPCVAIPLWADVFLFVPFDDAMLHSSLKDILIAVAARWDV